MTDTTPMNPDRSRTASALGRVDEALDYLFHEVPYLHNIVKFFFPVGRYVVDANVRYLTYLLVSIPVLAVFLGLAGLTVGMDVLFASLTASAAHATQIVGVIKANPYLSAAAVAALYGMGLVLYHPHDKKGWEDSGEGPTSFYAWEAMMVSLAIFALPVSYYAFEAFPGAFAPVFETVPLLSPFVAAVGVSLVLSYAVKHWMYVRYQRFREQQGSSASEYRAFTGGYILWYPPMLLYFAQVHFGVDLLLWGSPESPASALLIGAVVAMVLQARNLRRTLYEDTYGHEIDETLHVRVWQFIARVPLVFGVFLLVVGADVVGSMSLFVFSPLVASLGYLAYRLVLTGDMITDTTHDFTNYAGHAVWEMERQQRADSLVAGAEVVRAAEALNELLAEEDGQFTEVPTENWTYEDVRAAMKTIHSHEVEDLSNEEEYHERRRALKEALANSEQKKY